MGLIKPLDLIEPAR